MILSTSDMYDNEDMLLEHLANELVHERLSVIIGSGISISIGLPNWNALIDRCCIEMGISIPVDHRDNLRLAEYVRHRCDSYDEYLNLVTNQLYAGFNYDVNILRSNQIFSALANLVTSSSRGKVERVVTYNFDDVFEYYLQSERGQVVNVVSDTNQQLNKGDVNVLHPHGYLPQSHSDKRRSEWIVFDRLSYAERISELNKWWIKIQSILNSSTCLFVGHSVSDTDLDADIVLATIDHPTINAGNQYWGITFAIPSDDSSTNDAEYTCMHERGIYLKYVDNYDISLPNFLRAISGKAIEISRR